MKALLGRQTRYLLAAAALLMGGCVESLHALIGPFEERLRVTGHGAETAFVRVLLAEPTVYQLDASGRVTVQIPQYGRTCTTSFLFVIPVSGHRPENLPVLEVVVPGHSSRRFTIKQLHRVRAASDGFREISL